MPRTAKHSTRQSRYPTIWARTRSAMRWEPRSSVWKGWRSSVRWSPRPAGRSCRCPVGRCARRGRDRRFLQVEALSHPGPWLYVNRPRRHRWWLGEQGIQIVRGGKGGKQSAVAFIAEQIGGVGQVHPPHLVDLVAGLEAAVVLHRHHPIGDNLGAPLAILVFGMTEEPDQLADETGLLENFPQSAILQGLVLFELALGEAPVLPHRAVAQGHVPPTPGLPHHQPAPRPDNVVGLARPDRSASAVSHRSDSTAVGCREQASTGTGRGFRSGLRSSLRL